MEKWGLVLAGGGAKGAYHVGVWQALSELDINIAAVVGTSIGSINGALFVQGDVEKTLQLWENISLDKIIDLPGDENFENNLFDIKNLKSVIAEIYRNNGLTMRPLNELLCEIVNEEAIRKSPVEYGLATCNIQKLTPVELFKEDMKKGTLVPYLMASACLPGFQSAMVGNKSFVDGGVMNNMPTDMLISKGYENIITVDVGGVGVVKSCDTTGLNIIPIKCEERLLGTLEFKREGIAAAIRRGRLDCLKIFGRLAGEHYCFNIGDYCRKRTRYSKELLDGLECAAAAFGIDENKIYSIDSLVAATIEYYKKSEKQATEKLFEMIGKMKLDDKSIIITLVQLIENGRLDFLKNKLLMGTDNYRAAAAIIYFSRQ